MTHHNHIKAGLVLALAGGAFVAGSCGDAAREAAEAAARPARAGLERFLMRNDEQPGFRRIERVRTQSGVTAFARSNCLTPADMRQLRRNGFISVTFQPTRGPDTRGVTSVHRFATPKGARRWLAHEQRSDVIHSFQPGVKVRRFDVPGIPGARGWIAADGGNVYWVQGRCLLVLRNQGRGPFAGPLSTAARAIHERTSGQCS